jgi:hypothetical protein
MPSCISQLGAAAVAAAALVPRHGGVLTLLIVLGQPACNWHTLPTALRTHQQQTGHTTQLHCQVLSDASKPFPSPIFLCYHRHRCCCCCCCCCRGLSCRHVGSASD